MKIRHIVMTAVLVGFLSACSAPKTDLKSPCVGAQGSPCGPRHDVNGWWMNHDKG